MVQLQFRQVLELSGLEHDQVHEDVVERERLGLGRHGGDEGVVVSWETCEEIGENLLITEGSVSGDELGGKPRDLAEEVGDGQITFLCRGEFHTDLHCVCLRRRGELLLEEVLDLPRRCGVDDISEIFLGHRGEKAT